MSRSTEKYCKLVALTHSEKEPSILKYILWTTDPGMGHICYSQPHKKLGVDDFFLLLFKRTSVRVAPGFPASMTVVLLLGSMCNRANGHFGPGVK